MESNSTSHLSQSLTLLGEHRAVVRVGRHKRYCQVIYSTLGNPHLRSLCWATLDTLTLVESIYQEPLMTRSSWPAHWSSCISCLPHLQQFLLWIPSQSLLGWAGRAQRQGAGQPEEEAMMKQGQEMVSWRAQDRSFSACVHTEPKAT